MEHFKDPEIKKLYMQQAEILAREFDLLNTIELNGKKLNQGDMSRKDVAISTDIGSALLDTLHNIGITLNPLSDPQNSKANAYGRLLERLAYGAYRPGLKFIRYTAWGNPRLREDKIDQMIAMDLDSETYIEPILYEADKIILKHFDSWVTDKKHWIEPDFGGSYCPQEGRVNPIKKSQEIANRIEQLAELYTEKGLSSKDNLRELNNISQTITDARRDIKDQIEEIRAEVDIVLNHINNINVPNADQSMKLARVQELRNYLKVIQAQGENLYQELADTQEILAKTASRQQPSTDIFANNLREISEKLGQKAENTRLMCEQRADMSYTRRMRIVRERNTDGTIDKVRAAKAEDFRRLFLSIENGFTPTAPKRLRYLKTRKAPENSENFFIKAVQFGVTEARDHTKDPDPVTGLPPFLPDGRRGPRYGDKLAKDIAQMYSLNHEEDALMAIQYLKYHEGAESEDIFPSDFRVKLTQQFTEVYGISKEELLEDEHFSQFLDQAMSLSIERDHSPRAAGPRATQKDVAMKMKAWIFGRMYPGNGQFIATPFKNDYIEKPMIRIRGNILAHLTGGKVVPIAELGRAPKEGSLLEKETNLGIKRDWWWKAQPAQEGKESKLRFFRDAPFWAKAPVNIAKVAAIPVSAALLLGAAAPLTIAAPIFALGGIGTFQYGGKILKKTWGMPGNKFIKKWSVIAGATAATVKLGGLGLMAGLAVANPVVALSIAAPVMLGAGFKIRKAMTSEKKSAVIAAKDHKDYKLEIEKEAAPVDFTKDISKTAPITEIKISPYAPVQSIKEKAGAPSMGMQYTAAAHDAVETAVASDLKALESMGKPITTRTVNGLRQKHQKRIIGEPDTKSQTTADHDSTTESTASNEDLAPEGME